MEVYQTTVYFKIVRRTSKYNKNIKWFAETYRFDKTLLSILGYRTQKEARESVKDRPPMPVGTRMVQLIHKEFVEVNNE